MDSARPARTLSLPQLGAVVAGNALEFYDFLTFSFFAVQIGAVFFPGRSDTDRLLLSLATFGAGFLTRPLGAVVIGRLGDRRGRKPAMMLSFGLMGLSVAGLALTPSYGAIGMAAPVLAVLWRLVQGFALGGEVGPTTAFLMEVAPVHRRGLYVCLQNATQYLSAMAIGLVGVVLANILPPQMLTDWGWRAAMLLGAGVVPFAIMVRNRLPETMAAETAAVMPRRALLRLSLLALAILAALTIATNIMNYMSTFAMHTLDIAPARAFIVTAICGFCSALGVLAGGMLGDAKGRKPVMMAGAGLLLPVLVPGFTWIVGGGGFAALLAVSALLSFLVGLFAGPAMASVTENMPHRLRAGAVAMLYALAVAVFGGSAQFVMTWLIKMTGSPVAPAFYASAALLAGLAGMAAMPESAPVRVKS